MRLWGSGVGGFVPTKEFSAELYLRWFQFGTFCTLFRCHGRAWKLRLPWGWNTGDPGPVEISNYSEADIPDSSQLNNTAGRTDLSQVLGTSLPEAALPFQLVAR